MLRAILPSKVYAGKKSLTNPWRLCCVGGELVKVGQRGFSEIFDAKFIDYKDKKYRAPIVAPKARRIGGFVVARFVEAQTEKIVGRLARLGNTIAAADDLEIYSSVMGVTGDITFFDELFRDVINFDTHVLWFVHRRLEVEFLRQSMKSGRLDGRGRC